MWNDHAVSVDVETPQDYNEALDAAETLGLELSRVDAYGPFEAKDDSPVNPGAGGREVDISSVGTKWFYARLSGPDGVETVGVKPTTSAGYDRPGKFVMRFD